MRKICTSLLLLFLLVFAQVGSLVHEIGHQRSHTAAGHEVLPDHAGDRLCSLCLAFAQVAGMARPDVAILAPVAFRQVQQGTALPAGQSLENTLRHNRDPPLSA